jgi:pimeloyl-ACP methyl ester carboxylesterase
MTPQSIEFVANDIRFHAFEWLPLDGVPVGTALLTHGNSLDAASWWAVGPILAEAGYRVLSLDRRGHGLSQTIDTGPDSGYEFLDYTDDILAIVDQLALRHVYLIGHSAGGTELLLAAALKREAFERVFVFEPTLSYPAAPGTTLSEEYIEQIRQTGEKRKRYKSVADYRERTLRRPPFSLFHPDVLAAHIEHGFTHNEDGSIDCRCTAEIERKGVRTIIEAMQGCYQGDERGEPFHLLSKIRTPTVIATAGESLPVYGKMAAVGLDLIPECRNVHFPDCNHCVPMEAPVAAAKAILEFATTS